MHYFFGTVLYYCIRVCLCIFLQIVFLVQCQVSVVRINKYMNADELDPHAVNHREDYEDPVIVERANFSWSQDVNIGTWPMFSLRFCVLDHLSKS